MVRIIGEQNSVFNQFIAELRSEEIQKDSMRFRKNLIRVSEIMGYEVSKQFTYKQNSISTPLGVSEIMLPDEKLVVASILRAGLPMHEGLLNYFDRAENAFISAYRQYNNDGTFDIQFEYLSSPEIEGKTILLADPMLATGASMVIAFKGLLEKGIPKHTHILSVIASKEGIDYVEQNLRDYPITIWVGAVDDELTANGYIVPGLGDAGDLAFGEKT